MVNLNGISKEQTNATIISNNKHKQTMRSRKNHARLCMSVSCTHVSSHVLTVPAPDSVG